MKKYGIIKYGAAAAVFCLTCLAARYHGAELVRYEASAQTRTSDAVRDTAERESDPAALASEPDAIPVCPVYTLTCRGGCLMVRDDTERLLYVKALPRKNLTAADVSELERGGIRITARSELLELLSYLDS